MDQGWPPHLCLEIKFYWNTATSIYLTHPLLAVFAAEPLYLQSLIYSLALYGKRLLTPGMVGDVFTVKSANCVKMLVRTQRLPVTRAAPSLLLNPLHGKYFCERLLFQLYAFSFGNAVCVFIPESRNDKPGLLSFPFAVTFTAQLLKPSHPAHLAV